MVIVRVVQLLVAEHDDPPDQVQPVCVRRADDLVYREPFLYGADAQRFFKLRVVGEVALVILEIQDNAVETLCLDEIQVRLQARTGCRPGRDVDAELVRGRGHACGLVSGQRDLVADLLDEGPGSGAFRRIRARRTGGGRRQRQ